MREQKLPEYLQPMLVTLIDAPFDSPEWIFETKWDGFRLITESKDGKVTLYSRNGEVLNEKYPQILKSIEGLNADFVIDGELVALDKDGISRFELLQDALQNHTPLRYCVFDIMFLENQDLRDRYLLVRKQKLFNLVKNSDKYIHYTDHITEHGIAFFEKAKKLHEEGIVAKRIKSTYHSGKRTKDWLKAKVAYSQEMVVVGFTAPQGSRKYFGSLVLAVRAKDKWKYVGHVGTGFSQEDLELLYKKLYPLKTDEKPFTEKVKDENKTTWVKPKLVVEIKFSEWTNNGELRHPVYLGIRKDKDAKSVVREQPKMINNILHE